MKKGFKYLLFLGSALVLTTTACGSDNSGGDTPVAPVTFSFTLKLEDRGSSINKLFVGDEDTLVPVPTILDEGRVYEFSSNNTAIVINKDTGKFKVMSVPTGSTKVVTLTAKEKKSGKSARLRFSIEEASPSANGGRDYSTSVKEKTDIIGKLEEYAMKNFLTGMPIFENGGWVRYADRVKLGTTDYIPGYGFGLLREGKLTATNTKVAAKYGDYLLNAMSEDPATINAWQAQGSQVMDLNGYITSSFWGTKLNATKTDYEWYPILALNDDPIAIYDKPNALGNYKTWRVYLRTGEDKNGSLIAPENGGIYYRSSVDNGFNNRPIRAEDYLFTFKLLLQGRTALLRGTELATDTSYGFRGGNQFNKQSKNWSPAEITAKFQEWMDNGKLGIKLDWEEDTSSKFVGKPYIDFTFINAIDEFTAKYTLASNLYSPLPQAFLETIDSDYTAAGKKYGTISGSSIQAHVLGVGPYYLDEWNNKTSEILFLRNNNWYEVNATTYQIPGVYISVVGSDAEAQFNTFNTGVLDSTGFPKSKISEAGSGNDYQTVGSSTFKLNINSCTDERWHELFGPNGKVKRTDDRVIKPWMSNKNFLNGLFWSLDRKTFAKDRGVQPSVNYFADTYLSNPQTKDPEEIKVYNYTPQHEAALRSFGIDPDDGKYGYDLGVAKDYFEAGTLEMIRSGDIEAGTPSNPTTIEIEVWWMAISDKTEYGTDVAYYFEKAFNDACKKHGVVLSVKNEAVTLWEEVYDKHLQVGDFDLGFGAISGNTLNPLNFLEVLKSDNSSGFTLNWGADTGVVDDKQPIEYDGEKWSFDALWAAGDHGTIVKEGVETKPVDSSYLLPPTSDEAGMSPLTGGDLRNGGYVRIKINFANVPDLATDVNKISLSVLGSEGLEITGEDIKKVFDDNGRIVEVYFRVDQEIAEQFNEDIAATDTWKALIKALDDKYADKPTDPTYLKERDALLHSFTKDNYGMTWSIDLYYTFSIAGGDAIENFVYVDASASDVERGGKLNAYRLHR